MLSRILSKVEGVNMAQLKTHSNQTETIPQQECFCPCLDSVIMRNVKQMLSIVHGQPKCICGNVCWLISHPIDCRSKDNLCMGAGYVQYVQQLSCKRKRLFGQRNEQDFLECSLPRSMLTRCGFCSSNSFRMNLPWNAKSEMRERESLVCECLLPPIEGDLSHKKEVTLCNGIHSSIPKAREQTTCLCNE